MFSPYIYCIGRLHILYWTGHPVTLGGTFMLEEKENEEQHEIEELKIYSISESVQMKREQRKQRNQQYEEKLKVLQDKADQLKKELGYE